MKDYANPILLLIVIALIALRAMSGSESMADQLDLWLLALCVTGMLVDGALGIARALARRPSLMSVVWAVCFLALGCCIWAMRVMPVGDEQLAYMQQSQENPDPLSRDDEGETLFSRAAALGKADVVRDIINKAHPSPEHIAEAARRAAESDKTDVLEELARVGLSSKTVVNGAPLLNYAAQNASRRAMQWLIMRGADVNGRDAEGSTPLIQATLYGSVSAVKLLLEQMADPKLRDNEGKRPADYSRSSEITELLEAHYGDRK